MTMYEQPHYATISHYTVKNVHLNELFKLYLYVKLYSFQIIYFHSNCSEKYI